MSILFIHQNFVKDRDGEGVPKAEPANFLATKPAAAPWGRQGSTPRKRASLSQLKLLEPVQFVLDSPLQLLARAPRRGRADPVPFLRPQFVPLAIGLEIDGGNDVAAIQHRQREIAELALFPGNVSLEAMAVTEEQFGAFALDDEGIERRQDVHQPG